METINFMYFANNFSLSQLDAIFNALGNPNHFRDKLTNMRGESGTDKFFRWFMELSTDNQLIVTNWITANYKNNI